MNKKIGVIVNPVAGMGGSVGLKGTDGVLYKEALSLGAKSVTPVRTNECLQHIKYKEEIELVIANGKMGVDVIDKLGIRSHVIGESKEVTTAADTKKTAEEMLNNGIELLIFAGGDGTARDVFDVVGHKIPVVAIPSGVKVFSAVFCYSPRSAAELVDAFIKGAKEAEKEVLDIDEEAFRSNILSSKLYGSLIVPDVKKHIQGGKECSSNTTTNVSNKEEISSYLVENIEKNILYLLGPGTTIRSIAEHAGITKTLLGVDAYANGYLVETDIDERKILSLIAQYSQVKVIVTPIGGNGFIFGRGSKQFTPEVIKLVGRENIIVVATKDKVNMLEALRVDTGDSSVDQDLSGYMQVIIGYNEVMKMEVRS